MNKYELINLMWDNENLTPLSKLVFLALIGHYNHKTKECYPSMQTICDKTGIKSRNTVSDCINLLAEHAFISIKKIRPKGCKFTTNSYLFNFECSPNEQSNEQSIEQSIERSPNEHKPIEPIEPKKEITNVISKKKTATRFDLQTIPSEWSSFCIEQNLNVNPVETFQTFRDYWIAESSPKARKLDWFATWRNWVRRESANNTKNKLSKYANPKNRSYL